MSGTAEEALKELLMAMVRALVDNEDEIRVLSTATTDAAILFELDVAREDVGKLIGRDGKTANALRRILSNASTKLKVRSILNIPDKKGA